jgi:hypothetical protein
LFAYVDEILTNVLLQQKKRRSFILTLFHFSNFGASPAIDIYKIPPIFLISIEYVKDNYLLISGRNYVNSNYIKYIGYKPSYDSYAVSYNEKVKEISIIKTVVFKKMENMEL